MCYVFMSLLQCTCKYSLVIYAQVTCTGIPTREGGSGVDLISSLQYTQAYHTPQEGG